MQGPPLVALSPRLRACVSGPASPSLLTAPLSLPGPVCRPIFSSDPPGIQYLPDVCPSPCRRPWVFGQAKFSVYGVAAAKAADNRARITQATPPSQSAKSASSELRDKPSSSPWTAWRTKSSYSRATATRCSRGWSRSGTALFVVQFRWHSKANKRRPGTDSASTSPRP